MLGQGPDRCVEQATAYIQFDVLRRAALEHRLVVAGHFPFVRLNFVAVYEHLATNTKFPVVSTS